MQNIPVGQASIGDVIAEPIVNDEGRVLLPKGAKLSAAVLSRLQGWGVHQLKVEGEEVVGEEVVGEEVVGEEVVGEEVVGEEGEATDSADLLEELEHRFGDWEGDELMMEIKRIAQGHLRRRR